MIDPSTINPLVLPSMPLEERSRFPPVPCVYFAIDSLGIVQYIGKAADLRVRWSQHHKYNKLAQMPMISIAYLQVDHYELLDDVELALIHWFNPPLNGRQAASETGKGMLRVRRIVKQEVDVPGLGEQIKQAREKDGRSLSAISKAVGVSRNYWYQLEAEAVLGGMAEDTLRKIEAELGVQFGVNFD
jgi:DNA-binding XRE family transcriptional regulator